MSRADETARFTLPEVVAPTDTVCFQVPVPNDKFHIAAFKGSIYKLGRAYSWQNDPDHTAKLVASVWMEIFNNLEKCKPCPPNTGYAGAGGGDEDLMLRQNPDNPCELQNSVDGVTWCTWADLSKCVKIGQPGSGSEQPKPGGGQACYQAVFHANDLWLLPTSVSTGDTILLTDVNGAWTDGGASWRCPDGTLFVAGVCINGTEGYSGSNPVPSAPAMAIVVKIGSTFYAIPQGTPFTVPSGHSNDQVLFQANDDTLSDDSGQISFNVCVTNNAAVNWSHDINFAISNGHFQPQAYAGVGPAAVYTLGTGFVASTTETDDGSTTPRYTVDHIIFDWSTMTTITAISAKMNTTLGSNAGGSTLGQYIMTRVSGTNTIRQTISPPTNGSNQSIAWSGSASCNGIKLHAFIDDAGPGGTGGGTMTWLSIHVEGSGYDPFA